MHKIQVIVLCVVLSGGVLCNVYAAFALSRSSISSLLSRLLLYNQNFIDATYTLLTILLIATNNFTLPFPNNAVDPFVCYFLQSGYLSRVVRIILMCNIVCQSADRFWAIVYPNTYQVNTRRYIIVCYCCTPTYACLISLSRVLKVLSCNGLCIARPLLVSDRTIMIIESILRYGLPMSILITLNVVVVRRLYQLGLIHLSKQKTASSTSRTESGKQLDNATRAIISVQMGILLSAIVLMLEMTMMELVSVTLSILDDLELVDFSVNSLSRLYYCVLLSLVTAFNPCLEMLTIPALRRTVLEQWRNQISGFCVK
ncbi:unnamed protein product [Echinostoma caproni]|uniref:G_PROTEIN_RECEP_F1_2 domain-containing protein n=1 Tax=Echinostoma caproni TaxID=27848 RepID=A0A183A7V7_9TREM|nr:unnamed protein product [Echinostoma caproni]